MLEELRKRVAAAVSKLMRRPSLDRETVREFIKSLQKALLLADVNVEIVYQISRRIEKRALSEDVPPGLTKKEHFLKIVYDELTKMLGEKRGTLGLKPKEANVIMLIGIEGSGKTTTAAKLAYYFSRRGARVGLVSADVHRPAAREQLKQLAEAAGVDFFETEERDPTKIVEHGVTELTKSGRDVIIVDTAGRHKDERSLMAEMRQLAAALRPTHILLVVDATMGQRVYDQARAFHEIAPVGGVIVTKLDGAARGGGALSAVAATGAPVVFLGVGEKLEDLEPYDPEALVTRILGLPDLPSLLRKVEALEERKALEERAKRVVSGRFTLVDLVEQMETFRKLGPLANVLSMLGFNAGIPGDELEKYEDKIKRWRYILDSMTREEREKPEIIDRSRIVRIARGSGTTEAEVKELLRTYRKVKAAMKRLDERKLMRLLRRGFKFA